MTFRFLVLLTFFILHSPLSIVAGGSLFVQNVTTDANGKSTATVLYFDSKGAISPVTISDIQVNEGAGTVRVIDVKCPPSRPIQHVSSVLTIDVSGSMRFGGPNIVLARAAAQAWVEALTDSSDCALTTFDNKATAISDFTADKMDLTKKIQTILPHGGTSYDEGLLSPTDGGLAMASHGTKRRVLVFLTDGHGHVEAQRVISEAKRHNITVYCVSLGMFMPTVLRTVSEGSGGLWFDNVTTIEQAIMAYRRIFAHASGAEGCKVTWESIPSCDPTKSIRLTVNDATFTETVNVPDHLRGGCVFTPNAASFLADSSRTATVKITARAYPVTIRSLYIDRADMFSIDAGQLPRTLGKNETLSVQITRARIDTLYTVGRISIDSDPCPLPDYYVTAGDPMRTPSAPTLRVVHPNGGERFLVRSGVPLRWEGLPPTVPVRVEVSIDGGFVWTTVQEGVTGNTTSWRATKLPTDSCLLRVTHLKKQPDTLRPTLTIPGGKFFRVEFSPDGKYIATAEYFGARGSREHPPTVKLWDATTGQLLKELGNGDNLAFDATSSILIAWDHRTIVAFEARTGTTLWTKPVRGAFTNCTLDESGTRVLIVDGGGRVEPVLVVNTRTGAVIDSIVPLRKDVFWGTMSGDGKQVAICYRDSIVSLHSVGNGAPPRILREPGSTSTYRVAFSPDGSQLAMTSNNGTATLWDTKTATRRYLISQRQYVNDNTYLSFSPDGKRIAVEMSTDLTAIMDVATGRRLVSMRRASDVGGASGAAFLRNGGLMYISTLTSATILNAYTGVQTLRVPRGEGDPSSPLDGSRIAVIDRSLNVTVYPLNEPLLQQDVSDAMWSLFIPSGKMDDVLFADRFVGQAQDTVVTTAITNTSKDTLLVTSLRVEGGNAQDFSIASPNEFTIPPFATARVQYTFHPRAPGDRTATVVATTTGGRLGATLKGKSPKGILRAAGDVIDLGVHPVHAISVISTDSAITNVSDRPVKVRSVYLLSSSDSSLAFEPMNMFDLAPNEKKPMYFTFFPKKIERVTAQLAFIIDGISEPIITTVVVRSDSIIPVHTLKDPTTFRSIMLPSAVVPPQGTLTVGVYDFLGVQAGYSVTDNIMVLAGGALPLPNRWFGSTGYDASWSAAWAVGAKTGFALDSLFVVGGGYQHGQSYYDQDYSEQLESKITFNALWASAGYGTDDSRLNVYLGYAFKHHDTYLDGTFDADAYIVGIAYDYRIAEHWKICSEMFFMRTMSFVPITVTARYFREFDAFEAGLTVVGISASGAERADVPVIPMLTYVRRF